MPGSKRLTMVTWAGLTGARSQVSTVPPRSTTLIPSMAGKTRLNISQRRSRALSPKELGESTKRSRTRLDHDLRSATSSHAVWGARRKVGQSAPGTDVSRSAMIGFNIQSPVRAAQPRPYCDRIINDAQTPPPVKVSVVSVWPRLCFTSDSFVPYARQACEIRTSG